MQANIVDPVIEGVSEEVIPALSTVIKNYIT
jgi:hypothetical protein